MFLSAVLFAGIFSAWAAILYLHLRHSGLVALAAFAPLLPGIAVCWVLPRFDVYPIIPSAIFGGVFSIVVAQSVGDLVVGGICDGQAPHDAIVSALKTVAKLLGPVSGGFALWFLVTDVRPFAFENVTAACALIGAFAGTLIALMPAVRFSYSERFIADANRAREWRERMLEQIMFAAEHRWSFSLSGIALVFAALSAFGMRGLHVQADSWLPERLWALAAVVFVGALIVTRDWRLSVALTATLALLGALGMWAIARSPTPLLRGDLLNLAFQLAICAVPLTLLAASVRGYLLIGDDIATAVQQALWTSGPGGVLTAIVAAVPWILIEFAGSTMHFALVVPLANTAAVALIFPALAIAIYTLLPRYRTVDEVFGRR